MSATVYLSVNSTHAQLLLLWGADGWGWPPDNFLCHWYVFGTYSLCNPNRILWVYRLCLYRATGSKIILVRQTCVAHTQCTKHTLSIWSMLSCEHTSTEKFWKTSFWKYILRSKIRTIEFMNLIGQTEYKYTSSMYASSIVLVKRKPSMFFTSSVLKLQDKNTSCVLLVSVYFLTLFCCTAFTQMKQNTLSCVSSYEIHGHFSNHKDWNDLK